MSYKLTSFDGLAFTSQSMDISAGAVSSPLVSLPGGRSYDPLGTRQANVPSALFTAHALLQSSTPATLQSLFDAIQAKRGKSGLLYRTGDGGTSEYTTARLISASANRITSHLKFLPVTLVFQTANWPWQGAQSSPTMPDCVVSGTQYFTTFTNNGNADQKNIIFVFIATAAVSSIQVYNVTTGQYVTYGGAMASGDNLLIDTGAMIVTHNGTNDYANLTVSTVGTPIYPEWIRLLPGANSIRVIATFTGTKVACTGTFLDAWA